MRTMLTLLLASALTIPLASCATTGTGGIESSPCVTQQPEGKPAWRAIGWSQRDTPQTIREVKANNARHKAWCKTDS